MSEYKKKKKIPKLNQYNFINYRNNEFLGDNKISAGFDFYVPTPKIFPEPKDYFAIRDDNILRNEIYNLVFNPYRCTEDFIRTQRINNKTNNLVQDTYDTILNNFSISASKGVTTNADIYAFHCIYRFINKKDINGMIIRPDDNIINSMIDNIFAIYSNHTILAVTNKFTNSVHFLISNTVSNQDLIDYFKEYYDIHNKFPSTETVLFTKNIDIKFTDTQNYTEKYLYFTPKM